VLYCRVICLIAVIMGAIGVVRKSARPAMWLSSAWLLASAAGGMLFVIIALDARTMSNATFEYKQVTALARVIWESPYDEGPQWSMQRSWSRLRSSSTVPVQKDDETVADSAEVATFFAGGGWYLAIIGSILLFVAAYGVDVAGARIAMRKTAGPGLACVLGPWIVWSSACLVGHGYYDLAQTAFADGRYAQALKDYRNSVKWDPRLNYDTGYHYELGCLYGTMHKTDEADYWAMLGDSLIQSNRVDEAVLMYRAGARLPATVLFPERFDGVLTRATFTDEAFSRYGGATLKGREALALMPHNFEAIYALAICYTDRGDYKTAIELWKRLIYQSDHIGLLRSKFVSCYTYTKPIAARSWSALAFCYFQLGDYDKANRCVSASRVIVTVPTDWVGS
jgi:hypothetical protein